MEPTNKLWSSTRLTPAHLRTFNDKMRLLGRRVDQVEWTLEHTKEDITRCVEEAIAGSLEKIAARLETMCRWTYRMVTCKGGSPWDRFLQDPANPFNPKR